MRYSRLGDSGLIVSKLAFGAMTLGQSYAPLAGPVGTDAERIVGGALDAGITLFDTADVYHHGESETLLGQALGARRKDAVIATKAGMRTGEGLLDSGLSARHLMRAIDASLTRLGTDWIDLYLMHRPDPLVPLEETLRALDDIVRAGKVRYLGFSNWPAWLAASAVELQRKHGWARFVTGQMQYSLLVRDIEDEYLPMAAHHGVGTMVWSPLAGGMLTGKYTGESADGGRLNQMNLVAFDQARAQPIVAAQREIATRRGVPVAAVALAWLLTRPGISTTLLGFSSAAQLADNMRAVELELDPGELESLDRASAPALRYPANWMGPFVHRDAQVAALG